MMAPCSYISKLAYLLTYLLTYSLTYLLTPWSRILLEKLTGLQLVKKFPAFYGTQKFITYTSYIHISDKLSNTLTKLLKDTVSTTRVIYLRC
jgi:hypothetical protein